MCYINGTTDRTYTTSNRQAAHKYGTITIKGPRGRPITKVFMDSYEQTILEREFSVLRKVKYKSRATVYLTFRSRMDTKKAQDFLDEVAQKVGFKIASQ